jgi:hypothetical protein
MLMGALTTQRSPPHSVEPVIILGRTFSGGRMQETLKKYNGAQISTLERRWTCEPGRQFRLEDMVIEHGKDRFHRQLIAYVVVLPSNNANAQEAIDNAIKRLGDDFDRFTPLPGNHWTLTPDKRNPEAVTLRMTTAGEPVESPHAEVQVMIGKNALLVGATIDNPYALAKALRHEWQGEPETLASYVEGTVAALVRGSTSGP